MYKNFCRKNNIATEEDIKQSNEIDHKPSNKKEKENEINRQHQHTFYIQIGIFCFFIIFLFMYILEWKHISDMTKFLSKDITIFILFINFKSWTYLEYGNRIY